MIPQFNSFALAAGAVQSFSTTGRVMTIKTASLPMLVSINGGPFDTRPAGTVIPLPTGDSNQVSVKNGQTVSINVAFYFADAAVPFSAADSSQALAATTAEGNLGIPVSAAAGSQFTGSPACDANGLLSITNAMALKVASVNAAGHRRQYITFTMAAQTTSAVSLNVLDANSCVVMTLLPGALIGLPLDSELYLSGAGGTAKVTIGQHFLNQN